MFTHNAISGYAAHAIGGHSNYPKDCNVREHDHCNRYDEAQSEQEQIIESIAQGFVNIVPRTRCAHAFQAKTTPAKKWRQD